VFGNEWHDIDCFPSRVADEVSASQLIGYLVVPSPLLLNTY